MIIDKFLVIFWQMFTDLSGNLSRHLQPAKCLNCLDTRLDKCLDTCHVTLRSAFHTFLRCHVTKTKLVILREIWLLTKKRRVRKLCQNRPFPPTYIFFDPPPFFDRKGDKLIHFCIHQKIPSSEKSSPHAWGSSSSWISSER